MGTVYEATDERLHRKVALKLLKDDLAQDPKFIERFRREARSAAALSHPNVAGVFDYGEDDECSYIVMELAGGSDLARVLREEGPLAPERSARIAGQIATALAHAHSMGVVHRDIKPANVLVDTNDDIKVTDFGIARATGDSTLTATGSVLGTAHYLSPEQASGAPVGPASDVYSLGIVLYEMLTGAVPFTGDSAISVAMRHMNEEVPVPSALQPDVPAHLDDVVQRATQKEPEKRFADASEMSAVLLGGESALETSPLPTPGMVAGAASPTLVSGSGTEVLQTSGDREEGLSAPAIRKVLLILGALAAIVLLLALYRGFAPEDQTPAERRAEKKEGVSTDEEAEPAAAFEIPEDLYGESAAAFVAEAEAAGVIVEPVLIPTEDLDPGLILKVVPGEGTAIPEGETITLSVSSLPVEDEEDEDEDEDEEDEHGPPKGKGKPDKEDKGKD
jgi:serine/threonine-protein kinase